MAGLALPGDWVALLVVGAKSAGGWATAAATAFAVSELTMGLTVCGIGTSLPEFATSIVAVRHGQRDLVVGNVVGSNIFNIGAVAGLAAHVAPGGLPVPQSAVALDIPLMVAAAVVLLPIAFTGSIIARWKGAMFLGLHLTYTVLAAAERPGQSGFTTVMVWFVAPLVVSTVA